MKYEYLEEYSCTCGYKTKMTSGAQNEKGVKKLDQNCIECGKKMKLEKTEELEIDNLKVTKKVI